MDFESRSSTLIIDRLVKGDSWPESSRNYWVLTEKDNPTYFNQRALCTGCWSSEEYKMMEYWKGVPSASLDKWINRFRLLIVQADELSWGGHIDYANWEQQWLKTMMTGEFVNL